MRAVALLAAVFTAEFVQTAADVIPSPTTSFSVQFFNRTGPNSGVISSRFFTSDHGPADGQRLFTGVRLVQTNPNGGDWIGIERPSTIIHVKADQSVTNETSSVVALEDWPMGIAFDSKRLRNVLVSLSGEGALYQRNAAGVWSYLSSMHNRDLESFVYRPSDDTFWGFDVHYGDTNTATFMHQYNAAGAETREWIWPPLAESVQPGLYHSEMVVTDDDAIMLLIERPYTDALQQGDHSKMIMIRPEVGWFVTTYDQTAQQPPQVNFTTPTNGAAFLIGAAIPVTIHATDHDNDMQTVQLFDGDTLLRTWTPNPIGEVSLTYSWVSYQAGSHLLHARVTDSRGAVAEETIHVNINFPNDQLPWISISNPHEGQSFQQGAVVQITTVATNVVGLSQVSFLADHQIIALRTNSADPTFRTVGSEFRWSNAPAGNHVLTAIVANQGRSATSSPVNIIVTNPFHSPEVSFTNPTNGATFLIGGTVPVAIHASDADGDLQKIDLLDGDKLLQSWTFDKTNSASRTFSWISYVADSHILKARATDARGAVTEFSIIVNITFVSDAMPGVVIITPRAGQVFEPGVPVHILATASNVVGAAQFSFFANTNLIGLRTNTPQAAIQTVSSEFNWTNPPAGIYSLTTVVLNQGRKATSAPVLITIKAQPRPPVVRFVTPPTNSVVNLGDTLNVTLEYSDPDNDVTTVDLFDGNLRLNRWTFKPSPVGTNRQDYAWTPAALGSHTLRAMVYDSRQAVWSTNVLVNVLVTPDVAVERGLPDNYSAGQSIRVTLTAKPTATVNAWAVEDLPPTGWTARDVAGGAFDPVTHKVKWGPFTDTAPHTFSYVADPGTNTPAVAIFSGVVSVNGVSKPVAGDTEVVFLSPFHPADLSKDSKISVDELTAYAAAWKKGAAWPVAPTNIPVAYVGRAGFLWMNGEAYRFSPTVAAPLCWVPPNLDKLGAAPADGAAERILPPAFTPGRPVTVTIHALPGVGTRTYALQDEPPAGWAITDAGDASLVRGSLRFGPFYDDQARTFTYTVTPATNALRGDFHGLATFDGSREAIDGASVLRHSHGLAEPGGDRRVRLRFNATPGQRFAVESAPSLDSETWDTVGAIEGSDETVDFETIEAADTEHFYRLRPSND